MTRPTLGGRVNRRVLVVSLSAAAVTARRCTSCSCTAGSRPDADRAASRRCCRWRVRRRSPMTSPRRALRDVRRTGAVRRTIHAPGDLVTINAGTSSGIVVGQEYFTRRPLPGRARDASRPTTRRPSAPPAGFASGPWTRRCRWPPSRTPAKPWTLATTSSRSRCPPCRRRRTRRASPSAGTTRNVLSGAGSADVVRPQRLPGDRSRQQPGRDRRRALRHLSRQEGRPGISSIEIGEAYVVDVKADTSTLHVVRAHRRDHGRRLRGHEKVSGSSRFPVLTSRFVFWVRALGSVQRSPFAARRSVCAAFASDVHVSDPRVQQPLEAAVVVDGRHHAAAITTHSAA